MARVDLEIVEKYEALMKKDPFSKAFAPLAEAYFQNGLPDRAEAVLRDGLRKHPEYAPGLIVYSKVLKHRGQLLQSLEILRKASRLAPENVLALQILGDVYLELKRPREALKAYKSVLLLNPMASKPRSIVQKLESLSALDFEENTFSYARISSLEEMKKSVPIERQVSQEPPDEGQNKNLPGDPQTQMTQTRSQIQDFHVGTPEEISRSQRSALLRMLSLIDAFIARNDLLKATELIEESRVEFGASPELARRTHIVKSRGFSSQMGELAGERAQPLSPLISREKQIHKNKLEKLQLLLRKIDELRI